jgi:hypothetical protein
METNKQTRAEAIYAFIIENVNAGRPVTLWTMTKGTKITKRALPQVRVNGAALEVQCGKRWIDYTWVSKVTA